MSTVSPSLTPAEARILDALLADAAGGPSVPTLTLARSLNLSAADLLAFATSPAVAAALDTIRQTLVAIDAIRFHSFHTLALNTLAAVTSTAPNPNHRRQAATTLLRATNPAPTRRATQPRERAARASGLAPTNPSQLEPPDAFASTPGLDPSPVLHSQPWRPAGTPDNRQPQQLQPPTRPGCPAVDEASTASARSAVTADSDGRAPASAFPNSSRPASANNSQPPTSPASPDVATAKPRETTSGPRHAVDASSNTPACPPQSTTAFPRGHQPTSAVPLLPARREPTRAAHLTSHAGAPPRPP